MFGFDRKALYIVLIILVVFSIANMSAGEWLNILLTLPAVIIAINLRMLLLQIN